MDSILKVDDKTFDEELYRFYDAVREAGLSVINDWIKKGYIDDENVKKLVEHLDDNLTELLPND